MRQFDLTPFYRSTVGFDRLFSLLDQVSGAVVRHKLPSTPGNPHLAPLEGVRELLRSRHAFILRQEHGHDRRAHIGIALLDENIARVDELLIAIEIFELFSIHA